jgi:hypothetical protein
MSTSRRVFCVLIILTIGAVAPAEPGKGKLTEEDAVARIKELGGRVERDRGKGIQPIWSATFNHAVGEDLTDAKLATLIDAFNSIPALRDIVLTGTRVTDAGLLHVAKVRNLVSLDVSMTKVTDEGIAHLKGMPKLRDLMIFETKVTRRGVAELRKSIPQLRTYADPSTDKPSEPAE